MCAGAAAFSRGWLCAGTVASAEPARAGHETRAAVPVEGFEMPAEGFEMPAGRFKTFATAGVTVLLTALATPAFAENAPAYIASDAESREGGKAKRRGAAKPSPGRWA